MMQQRIWQFRVGLTIIAIFIAPMSLADEIVLKGSVRLRDDSQTIRLADIADLSGPIAAQFADTAVADAPRPGQVTELSIRAVRRKLDEAGIHWGKVQLNGRKVVIRPFRSSDSNPPLAMSPSSVGRSNEIISRSKPKRVLALASSLLQQRTLRSHIAAIIAQGLNIEAAKLRLEFAEKDTAFLDTSQDVVRFEVQPLSSFHSDRIELSVRTWSGSQMRENRTVTVRPRVLMDTIVLSHDTDRGDVLHENELTVTPQWLSPSAASQAIGLVGAVGRIAATRLKAGKTLQKKHVKRSFVIKRGDRVIVRCFVGGVVVSLEAEARSDAAKDEFVELRKPGEKDTFTAVASGPHAAIKNLQRH